MRHCSPGDVTENGFVGDADRILFNMAKAMLLALAMGMMAENVGGFALSASWVRHAELVASSGLTVCFLSTYLLSSSSGLAPRLRGTYVYR